MAAEKMGLTRKLWCLLKVLPYASLNDVDNSSLLLVRLCRRPCAVKSRPLQDISKCFIRWRTFRISYLTSQTRPSVATCFPVLSSLRTRSWRFSDSNGAANRLSFTFCRAVNHDSSSFVDAVDTLTLPRISLFTGLNAAEPRTSVHGDQDGVLNGVEGNTVPNNVARDSAASKNLLVLMALSLLSSTGTSVKEALMVSKNVPPGGYVGADMLA